MPQDYYPSGPFLSQLPDAGEFDVLREDFLIGFMKSTARAYKADLKDFREWCEAERVEATRPSGIELERFLDSVRERGYAAGTVARRLGAVRGFLRRVALRRVLPLEEG